ncbi:MAG: ABC transporter substrate-binding protein [Victivallales bacterium]|nr:ABC transporter substrate-binding protein [Victivallales bacterium]
MPPSPRNRKTPLAFAILATLLFCVLGLFLCISSNNPWPKELAGRNCLFTPVRISVKTLDPATAYYEHEGAILDNIVEMPFGYHYLKRPYQLEPMLAESIPTPAYFDSNHNPLPDNAPENQIARVEYTIHLKKGVQYQPHPCFALDEAGKHPYFDYPERHFPRYASPDDFPLQGSREMVAEDFKVALTRLCSTQLASPIYSTFKSFILGMQECSDAISKQPEEDFRNIPLAGIELVDDYTFKLILTRKYPQLLYWMAMHFFSPIPWEALAFYGDKRIADMGLTMNHYPVGTGAYRMALYEQDNKMLLKRNLNHREDLYPTEGEPDDSKKGLLEDAGKQCPFIDEILFFFERESIPGWIKFNLGYYDMMEMPADMLETITDLGGNGSLDLSQEMQQKGIHMHSSVRLVSYYYGFNMLDKNYGGFTDSARKLRQAISIAINPKEYIDIFTNGCGTEAQSFLPPDIAGGAVTQKTYNTTLFAWQEDHAKRLPIDHAIRLMAEAGYPGGIGPDGKRLTLSYDNSSAGNAGFKSQFLWLKGKLELLGIELIDNGTDLNRFRDKVANGNWQFIRKGWVADYPDAENFLFCFYGPNAHAPNKGRGANYTNYMNPEFDALFKQLESMQDSPERIALIQQANSLLQQDAPCVWDYHPKSFSLTQPWLKNYKSNEISKTNYKYRRIDAEVRNEAIRQRNSTKTVKLFTLAGLLCSLLALCFLLSRRTATP